jgi:hypothetical protein
VGKNLGVWMLMNNGLKILTHARRKDISKAIKENFILKISKSFKKYT